tara:strand:- start:151 stop:504 length:354 start_codon:yes stop_codon:yes gene_type:complete
LLTVEVLISLATDYLQATQKGFTNKDSGGIVELITDDFQLISPITTRTRQELLDWVDGGGNSTTVAAVFDVKVLYKNDDVAAVSHGKNSGETYTGKVLCCGRKGDGKFYDWRLARSG